MPGVFPLGGAGRNKNQRALWCFLVVTGIGDKERDEEQNHEEGEEQDKELKEQNNEDEEQDEEQNKERTRRRRTRNRTEEKEEEQDEEQNEKARTSTRNALQRLPQHVRNTQGVSVPFAPSLTGWCHAVFAVLFEHFFIRQF